MSAAPGYLDPHYSLHPDGSRVERLEDIVRKRAAATPELPAVIAPEGTTTFAELDRQANRVAQALLRDGVVPGDRVSYVGENAASFLAVLYGASKMGAIPTALNFRLAVPEVEHILGDTEPAVVVLGRGQERLAAAAAAVGSVRSVVTVEDGPGTTGWVSWLDRVREDDPGYARGADETALMFYSSGTTGRPKGIELTGPNLGQALAAMHYLLEFDTTAVALAPIPFFHVSGLGLALVATLNGSALLLRNPTSPADLCRILQEEKVTHAVAVPTVIQFLMALPQVREGDWSRLRYMIYGAAPMPESVLRDATSVLGCKFLQSYGLTESTGGVTILMPEDHDVTGATSHRLRSVGRPMANVPVRIVDPVTLEDLPAGERGEVLIGGGHVMRRYWRDPAATAATLTPDGWLRSGDGGSFDEDGYLYLHDRLKDMIVSGGENVYPAEVESILTGHPDVAQAAVVGVPSQTWGESPIAVVVRVPGATLTEAELIAWSREHMAHFKCPISVAFVDELPLNASGKLLKTELRSTYGS
ncbi:long-chain-fatty-acid--CoA ligase [Aeromicrobium wangtongii]|uniref:Long-chain-fatty-acid--CoA ligase n=1 Tax=Aeromicrobium wangtongii TaxID=2969247 RepID=A0ABY5M6P4_9ACTN|nr:long-chain-fatty-acid--CoA ligase [Aeromicrobium wangtongii]MCD9199874.1 long-chain-fatty-acid--CoA ligase [Aeromicrobium wangtongii]UUP13492.1 long-chain-fatty-acid--CoA ligase [Aeromicrobium wangtongii]